VEVVVGVTAAAAAAAAAAARVAESKSSTPSLSPIHQSASQTSFLL